MNDKTILGELWIFQIIQIFFNFFLCLGVVIK